MKKLVLKKETITKLNNDQMKQFVGGLAAGLAASSSSNKSCCEQSCNSQANTGSCEDDSCSCDKLASF